MLKQTIHYIIGSIILCFSACDQDPSGLLLYSRVNTRNPKYSVELKIWDSFMTFGSGTSRLRIIQSGSNKKIAELNGTGRFAAIYWKDADNLIVIDLLGLDIFKQQRVHKFKYGKLTISNICYTLNGSKLDKFTCDSLALEEGSLSFYNTDLNQNSKLVTSSPIDQFIFSNTFIGNTVKFEVIPFKSTEPISDFRIISIRYEVELSDSNIVKLKNIMSQKMN